MAFTVTGPEVTYGGRVVKALFTEQIIFNIQIIDISETQINNYDETGAVTIIDLEAGAGDKTAIFPVGSVVWLNVVSGAGYVGRGVISTSVFGTPHAGQTTLTFTEKFGIGSVAQPALDPADFLYSIAQKLGRFWKLYDAPTAVAVSGELYVHPDETGLIEIDTGPVLKDYLRANSLTDFYFSFGFSEGSFSIFGTDYLAIDGGTGPANATAALDYVIHRGDTGGGGGIYGAQALSRFWKYATASPTSGYEDMAYMWEDWTTSISYLFDDDTGAVTVYIETFDMFDDGIPTHNTTLETITTAATDPQVYHKDLPAPHADAIFLMAFFSDVQAQANARRKVVFKVIKSEDQPQYPVMVKWLNSLGGYSHWLFGCSGQVLEYAMTGRGLYETPRDSTYRTSPLGSVREIDSKKTEQKITLQANYLTFGQLTAIKEILSSQEVYIYADKAGTTLVRATSSGSFTFDFVGNKSKTREEGTQANAIKDFDGVYNIEITVNLPPEVDYYRDFTI